MSTLRIVLAVAVLGTVLFSPAAAAVAYTVTDLGPGKAYAVNNAGQVVGGSLTMTYNGFLYSNGVTNTNLWTGGPAIGMNSLGQAVGFAGYQACVWSNGNVTYLGNGIAYGINDSGVVVGTDGNPGQGNAVLWSNGTKTTLGAPYGCAYAINNAGQVVGNNGTGAFLYSNGVMTNLGSNYDAYGINNAGEVVGSCYNQGKAQWDACLWSNGTVTDIGGIAGAVGPSFASAINNTGQIVGYSGNLAFLYSNGVMTDLNNLIDPTSGWTLEYAGGINDNGQIVGYGITPTSGYEAFLLDPVPEPATMGLIGMGLSALFARRRLRR